MRFWLMTDIQFLQFGQWLFRVSICSAKTVAEYVYGPSNVNIGFLADNILSSSSEDYHRKCWRLGALARLNGSFEIGVPLAK